MIFNITEKVDTVGWSDGVSMAPAELVRYAKEMSERGEPVAFAHVVHPTTPKSYTWCVMGVNDQNQLYLAKRHTESIIDS